MRFPRYLSSLNKTQISGFRCLHSAGFKTKKGGEPLLALPEKFPVQERTRK